MSELESQVLEVYGVINKVYYREFDDEIAGTVLNFYQGLELARIQLDPVLYFEISSLPYRLISEVEGYKNAGSRSGSRYSGGQEIKRVELLAGLVFRILQAKAKGEEITFSWDEASDHLTKQFDWEE
jgi:hypothetical protein